MITIDTLHIFKSNMQINRLKETSYLSLCTMNPVKYPFVVIPLVLRPETKGCT